MATQSTTYWISDRRQLAALSSPVRQEIVDAVSALGSCTIARIGEALGVRPDRLYFHVRRLQSVGLLVRTGELRSPHHVSAVYSLPGKQVRIEYDQSDARRRRAISSIHDGVLRLARRDLRRAMNDPAAIVAGPASDTRAGRCRGWLTADEIRELNALIERLNELVRSGSPRPGAKPITLTYVMAPPRQRSQPGRKRGVRTCVRTN